MPYGVFVIGPGGTSVFLRAPPLTDGDTLAFTLKTPWSDGTAHLLLSPLELLEKPAALAPSSRLNLVRYWIAASGRRAR